MLFGMEPLKWLLSRYLHPNIHICVYVFTHEVWIASLCFIYFSTNTKTTPHPHWIASPSHVSISMQHPLQSLISSLQKYGFKASMNLLPRVFIHSCERDPPISNTQRELTNIRLCVCSMPLRYALCCSHMHNAPKYATSLVYILSRILIISKCVVVEGKFCVGSKNIYFALNFTFSKAKMTYPHEY